MNERVRVTFTAKQYPNGQPWISVEPLEDNLKVLRNGFLSFDLRTGTAHEEALRIAAYLAEHITEISYYTTE